MVLIIVCGTWIKGDRAKVVEYIRSCAVFPNIARICRATGVSEPIARSTVDMLQRQEELYANRTGICTEDAQSCGMTRNDPVIGRFWSEEMDRLPVTPENVAAFLNLHRYYDGDGRIRFRFSAEEVAHAAACSAI